ncbi:MAG: hypothetical protein JXR51_12445 [Bacteroidales bacterium]|nr:hypothetical protein [Bacteroidales bacterium]
MNKTKTIILFLILIFSIQILKSQEINVIKAKGEALIQWYPEIESLNAAKERAYEKAKINALENEYGTLVVQGNSVYIENKNTGEKTETNTVFKMIGNIAVKGEIIEIIKTDYKEIKKKEKVNGKKSEITYIECKVILSSKEIVDTKIDIEAYPLNSNKLIRPVTDFYEGDDLFLFFRSPVNGFLTVYLDDNKDAQCLLPYRKMPKGMEEAFPIEADKDYVFFSDLPNHNYFNDDFFAEDTYELYASTEKDLNRMYVIFSKSPLNKLILKESENNKLKVEIDKENYELPKVIDSDTFQKWLIKIQQIRNDLIIKNILISIEKNKH